jgi:hypothetical protein
MGNIDVTAKELLAPAWKADLATDETHRITCTVPTVTMYEAEDANYHFRSPVFMPMGMELAQGEERLTVSSLETLAQALEYAKSSGKPLCLLGHTDSAGSAKFNLSLSERRAAILEAFLTGDREGFVALCRDHQVEDVQHILTWVAFAHGYGCDPQGIDGIVGSNTRNALAVFRDVHEQEHGVGLPQGSHPAGDADWGAFYDLYEISLARLLDMEPADLASLRGSVTWHSPAIVGCGEAFLAVDRGEDGLRTAQNRRVDLVFLEDGDFDDLGKEERPGATVYGRLASRTLVPIEPTLLPLKIQLLGYDRKPLANKAYVLEVAAKRVEDVTDGDGILEQEVPASALFGDLQVVVEPAIEADAEGKGAAPAVTQSWKLFLGPMPSQLTDMGVQARLAHIGASARTLLEGQYGVEPDLVAAYQQSRDGLEHTGALDDDTRSQLDDEYTSLA